MTVSMMADKGIFVQFELRPEEDRAETMKVGHPVFKDVEYALITPAGGNLRVEKIVDELLLREWRHGTDRKPPRPYLIGQYEAWKAGNEPAVNGTDIKNWPGATPAQIKTCVEANLRTIEDLSTASEGALARLGMGGRALKEKAIAYLKAAQDAGVAAETIAGLKAQLDNMKVQIETLTEANERLSRELPKRRKE